MDKVERYREIVSAVIAPLGALRYTNIDVANELIIDRDRDRYVVLTVGWEGNSRRIHSCLVHLDIVDGKVWIQQDHTEEGIGYALEAAGIPPTDIVPAFHPPNVRQYTGCAVA